MFTGRRGMVVALTLLTSGAAVLLLAASQWLRSDSARLLPHVMSDAEFAADAARACGWLALTGVAGVLATRSWLRSVVGAVLLVVAGMTLYVVAGGSHGPWRWVAIAGCLAVIGAALLVVTTGRRWPSLSRRYDRDGGAAVSSSEPPDLWRALDRGDDPT